MDPQYFTKIVWNLLCKNRMGKEDDSQIERRSSQQNLIGFGKLNILFVFHFTEVYVDIRGKLGVVCGGRRASFHRYCYCCWNTLFWRGLAPSTLVRKLNVTYFHLKERYSLLNEFLSWNKNCGVLYWITWFATCFCVAFLTSHSVSCSGCIFPNLFSWSTTYWALKIFHIFSPKTTKK